MSVTKRTNIQKTLLTMPSTARTIAKYRAISSASQSSGGCSVTIAGSPCNMFQSLQTACRTSSMRVVDVIPAASLVARATGIRRVSGENPKCLPPRLAWPASRESTRSAVVSDGVWFEEEDMVQKVAYRMDRIGRHPATNYRQPWG